MRRAVSVLAVVVAGLTGTWDGLGTAHAHTGQERGPTTTSRPSRVTTTTTPPSRVTTTTTRPSRVTTTTTTRPSRVTTTTTTRVDNVTTSTSGPRSATTTSTTAAGDTPEPAGEQPVDPPTTPGSQADSGEPPTSQPRPLVVQPVTSVRQPTATLAVLVFFVLIILGSARRFLGAER